MKIVMTTVGTTGDISPFVALGERLRQEGYRVRACSHDLFQSSFESVGVEFVPVGVPMSWERIGETGRRLVGASPREQIAVLQEHHLQAGEKHFRDCLQATRGFDLAIGNAVHNLGQAAAATNGVPWIGVRLDPVLLPTGDLPPFAIRPWGPFANRWLRRRIESLLTEADARLEALMRSVGARRCDGHMFRATSSLLNWVACSRHLTGDLSDLPAHFQITGDWRRPGAGGLSPDLERFLTGDPPPVVVTLGSMASRDPARLTRTLLQGIEKAGVRAILQTGRALVEIEPADDAVLFQGEVPHDLLFPRAACVIHHGGAGTTHAACRAGVPSIVMPHVGDQFFWAGRLRTLGVAPGPLAPASLGASELARRIATVVTRSRHREAAGALAREMAEEDGLAVAVKSIQSLSS